MNKLLVCLSFIFLAACSSDYKPIGAYKGNYFVLVSADKVSDKVGMTKYAMEKCNKKSFCQVMFWEKGQAEPRNFPLTPHEVEIQLMQYNSNKASGLNRVLWNCKVYPDTSSDSCFDS